MGHLRKRDFNLLGPITGFQQFRSRPATSEEAGAYFKKDWISVFNPCFFKHHRVLENGDGRRYQVADIYCARCDC